MKEEEEKKGRGRPKKRKNPFMIIRLSGLKEDSEVQEKRLDETFLRRDKLEEQKEKRREKQREKTIMKK